MKSLINAIQISLIIFTGFFLFACGSGSGGNSTTGGGGGTISSAELQNKQFNIPDGEVFHERLAGAEIQLSFGMFNGNVGTFTLASSDGFTLGTVTLGSCIFDFTFPSFLGGPGFTGRIHIDPCTMSPDGTQIFLTNIASGSSVTATLLDPGASSSLAGIYGVLTDRTDFPAVVVNEGGERLAVITAIDPVTGDMSITGTLWTTPSGAHVVTQFGVNGLPREIVFDNGVIVLFSNYTNATVDIAVIALDGSVEIARDIPLDPLVTAQTLLANMDLPLLIQKPSFRTFPPQRIPTISEFLKIGSLGTSGAMCSLGIVSASLAGTLPVAALVALGCTSTFFSAMSNALPSDPAWGNMSDGFSIFGCVASGFSGDLSSCYTALAGKLGEILGLMPTNDRAKGSAQQALMRPFTVIINEPLDGQSFNQGDPISFFSTARYQNGGHVWGEYIWESNINGILGTTSFLSFFHTLSPGTHSISLRVIDSDGDQGAASITITVRQVPVGGGGPWIGNWTQVNFLATDDNGVWGTDDPSGIGFIAVIDATTWIESDEQGCAVTYSYSVDSNFNHTKRGMSYTAQCPFSFDPGLLTDSGHLEFSQNDNIMDEYFNPRPGDTIAGFRWMKQ